MSPGVVALAAALAGCGGGDRPPEPGSPTLPDVEPTVLLRSGWGLALAADPRQADPVTAYASCLGIFESCVRSGAADLDGCVRSAPVCRSDRPWDEAEPCCPASCLSAYETRAAGGVRPHEAVRASMVDDVSCFPGLPE